MWLLSSTGPAKAHGRPGATGRSGTVMVRRERPGARHVFILHGNARLMSSQRFVASHSDSWLPSCGKDIRKLKPEDWESAGEHAWIGRPDHVDRNGEVIPTDWRTFAVKEKIGWLEAARATGKLMSDPAKWREAIVGPWQQSDNVSPLGLDPTAYQDGARQASNLSTVGLLATAGAVWLAVNAFPLFPVLPGAKQPLTTGLFDGSFPYPTWSEPLPLAMIRAICRVPWSRVNGSTYVAYGIRTIWQSEISLTATGRRQFGPARPV